MQSDFDNHQFLEDTAFFCEDFLLWLIGNSEGDWSEVGEVVYYIGKKGKMRHILGEDHCSFSYEGWARGEQFFLCLKKGFMPEEVHLSLSYQERLFSFSMTTGGAVRSLALPSAGQRHGTEDERVYHRVEMLETFEEALNIVLDEFMRERLTEEKWERFLDSFCDWVSRTQ